MYHFLFILLFLIGVPPHSKSQGTQLLEMSRTSLDNHEGFTSNFTYTSVGPRATNSRSEQIQGEILFKKRCYVVSTPQEEIYCDLIQQWFFNKNENTYIQQRYEPAYDLTLEAIYQLYRNRERARYEGRERLDGTQMHKVYVPLSDSRLDHTEAYVWIHPETYLIIKVVLINRRQVTFTYHFSEVRPAPYLSTKDFTFDLESHPGATRIRR